jgi:outer membrane protein W
MARCDAKGGFQMRAPSIAKSVLVLLLLSAALPAVSDDTGWTCRFGLLYNSPTGDLQVGSETTEADDSTGVFASVEFRVTKRFGIEPGIGFAEHDIDVKEPPFPTVDAGDTSWMALTVNGNFHLLPERKLDLYAGPTVGYVFWGDLESAAPSISTDDEPALGVNVGLDVPIGDTPWSFAAAVRYLATDLSIQGGADIGIDPFQIKAGLARNF